LESTGGESDRYQHDVENELARARNVYVSMDGINEKLLWNENLRE
jgi:hypothetical protein